MTVEFLKKFEKDLKRLNHKPTIAKVQKAIIEVKAAEGIEDISNIQKMKNADVAYRIRVGDYRIGLYIDVEIEVNHAVFARVLHRKDIYKFFP